MEAQNNKALEIFNPSDDVIDMSAYRLSDILMVHLSLVPIKKLCWTHWVVEVACMHLIRDPDATGLDTAVWEGLKRARRPLVESHL